MKDKTKEILVVVGIVLIILAIFIIYNDVEETNTQGTGGISGGSAGGSAIQYVPLTNEERQQVSDAILSSEFVSDIPEKYPVAITFFNFKDGERVIQDSFLVNKKGFLSEGTPEVRISLHAKYISDLNTKSLCDIIQTANKAGDLAFSSESGKVSLFLKYASLLKHRSCFGF